jgi:DnaJ-class molecular chaperone
MMEDTRAHICYVCNGEGATMDGDCPNCQGTGVLSHFREEEKEC